MKLFRNIGIIAIAIFSFFYTEKIANYMLENNKLYQSIEEKSENYNIKTIDAVVNGEYVIPGLNGKKVNIKDSYYNMKEFDNFNSLYLIYDTTYPENSLENNKDKIIKMGNKEKNNVAFILEYDKNIIDFFINNNIDASVLVDMSTFSKDNKLEQINNDIKNFNNLESLLNKYTSNPNICFLNKENENICKEKQKYLVTTDKIINNNTIITIKNSISSGSIYKIEKNTNISDIKLIINSILYKDLDIVRLSELISEEISWTITSFLV